MTKKEIKMSEKMFLSIMLRAKEDKRKWQK